MSIAHPIQFFEYLLSLKRLTMPVVRHVSDYKDRLWWQSELPLSEGCILTANSGDSETWLEVHKQNIEPPPAPPLGLSDWMIDKGAEPDVSPQVRRTRPRIKSYSGHDLLNSEEERFEEDPDRVATWNSWLKTKWEPWALVALPKVKVQRLYGELFGLYQRIQREADAIELVWGHGLITWNIDGFKVCRPLLTTRMELVFEAKDGTFKLIPSGDTILEFDMLSGVQLPNPGHIVALERSINTTGIDPWDVPITNNFFIEAAEILSPDSKVRLKEKSSLRNVEFNDFPTIYDAPVLLIRRRAGRQWETEIQTIIDAIREGKPVPTPIECLIKTDGINIDEKTQEEWLPVGEELLFPLPANEDQKEIVRRLSRNIGVVVQGPPGTGKSHTIVNLVAHLLAHGKRVLVTSQTERALKVLGQMIREKLPSIAPLCVSVLGGDARSMSDLDDSIAKICEHLDSINNPEKQKETIEDLRNQLDACRRGIAKLRTALGKAYELEASSNKFDLNGALLLPLDLANWISDNQAALGWIPDVIDDGVLPPLTEGEMVELFRRLQGIPTEDERALSLNRPTLEAIENSVTLKNKLESYDKAKAGEKQREEFLRGWSFKTKTAAEVRTCLSIVKEATKTFSLLKDDWLIKVLEDVLKGGERCYYWEEVIKSCHERISQIRQLSMQLAEYAIQTPPVEDLRQFSNDLALLRTEFDKNGKPSFLFKHLKGKSTLYILECKINGSLVKDIKDLDIITNYLQCIDAKQKLVLKWNNSITVVSGPLLQANDLRMLEVLEDNIERLEVSFKWRDNNLPQLQNALKFVTPHGKVDWTNRQWLEQYEKGLNAYIETLEYEKTKSYWNTFLTTLKEGSSSVNAHPAWSQLLEAFNTRNYNNWNVIREEIQRLKTLQLQFSQLQAIRARLEVHTPRWLFELEREARRNRDAEPPENWIEAWNWKRADSWLRKHFESIKTEQLYEDILNERAREGRIIDQLVSSTTWLEQLHRTSDTQRRSLRSWVQTMRKIGKGTGKYAAKHRADAKKEMDVCRTAVPVWIMPINRVIESLKPTEDPFDVVILDEASQSDVFAWSVLYRAKKVVVVGDDRQISPEGVGKDQTEVNKLIDRHLIGIPQRERFTLQDSLYDMALRVFPGQQLMLKEHFRCVPEIIQFCNDNFYGEIEPLRVPSSKDRFNPPIVTVRVDDGYRDEGTRSINEPEAIRLAEKVAELSKTAEYRGKSFGVISLQGKEQAYLIEQKIRELIGESEMIERRIVCGDAYSFQGDERDVMFLSLVAAPNVHNGVLNKRTDEQRFNVAVSRARDQLWLFHSIDLDKLNPTCMRYRLLQYCLDPKRTQLEMDNAEERFTRFGSSKFHKDVYKMIVARGYRAIPEYKVGTHPYRIDIVIEGHRSRLAVECDGDEWHGLDRWEADLERQTILERVGWKFWRVRGSTFYRNRERSLESLWELLDELEITPSSHIASAE